MRILSIETSCDDTGIALIETHDDGTIHILSNQLSTQTQHAAYGGVFPTLAKREHAKMLVPLLEKALEKYKGQTSVFYSHEMRTRLSEILAREPELLAQIVPFLESHTKPNIDAIAVTYGPGLEPCLWVGICCAKALSYIWDVPVVGVNHMEGHIYAALVGSEFKIQNSKFKILKPTYPLLSLLISGGHTELVLSEQEGEYTIFGQTRDDAVGECFDKCARMLGLEYPGGPKIGKLAAEARAANLPRTYTLPRPMLHSGDLDFSFSGLKTAVLKMLTELRGPTPSQYGGSTSTTHTVGPSYSMLADNDQRALAREIEETIADVLVRKTCDALTQSNAQTLIVSGGVSASTYIREQLTHLIATDFPAVTLLFSPRQLATDNALMIALAAISKVERKEFVDSEKLVAQGNLRLGT